MLYEVITGQPARAIDAYSFYLPRIRSEELRDRLRFRVARVASRRGSPAMLQLRSTPTTTVTGTSPAANVVTSCRRPSS